MRRYFLPMLILLFLGLLTPALAEEYIFVPGEGEEKRIGEAWDEFLGQAPEGMLGDAELDDPAAALSAVRGEADASRLWKRILAALKEGFLAAVPAMTTLFSLLLLHSAVRSAAWEEKMREAVSRFLRLSAALAVIGMAREAVELARGVTGTVCRLAELIVPAAEGICLMGGGVSEGRAVRVGMMLLLTLAEEVVGRLLLPAAGMLLGVRVLSAGGGVLSPAAKGIGNCLTKLWQGLTLFVSFLLGAQSVLGKASDSLGQRLLKFTVSSFVPVAGGALSEAWGTLSSGVRVLRGTVGIGGMLVLFASCLPSVIALLLRQGMFSIGKGAAELLSLSDLAELFETARSVCELLSAFVLYVFALFILSLVLFSGVFQAGS